MAARGITAVHGTVFGLSLTPRPAGTSVAQSQLLSYLWIIILVHPDEASCVHLGREMHGPALCRDLAAPCGLTARYCPRLFAPKGP
jgi:hypothetical protein